MDVTELFKEFVSFSKEWAVFSGIGLLPLGWLATWFYKTHVREFGSAEESFGQVPANAFSIRAAESDAPFSLRSLPEAAPTFRSLRDIPELEPTIPRNIRDIPALPGNAPRSLGELLEIPAKRGLRSLPDEPTQVRSRAPNLSLLD